MTKTRNILIAATTLIAGLLVSADAMAQKVKLVQRSGAWSLFADTATPKQVCFVSSQPTAVEPLGANRGSIYFYVSAWPKDGIKVEPSVKLGYPIKPESEVTVTIGTDVFKLFPKDQRAFVADPTEELKLIEALKKGANAVVQATSEKGTSTTDTYSLSGSTKALELLASTCS